MKLLSAELFQPCKVLERHSWRCHEDYTRENMKELACNDVVTTNVS